MEDNIEDQIKTIGKDIENYGDIAVDAISEYLANEDGIPDDIMMLFKHIIESSQNFDKRYTPLTTFINAAIAWKARQIVLSSAT